MHGPGASSLVYIERGGLFQEARRLRKVRLRLMDQRKIIESVRECHTARLWKRMLFQRHTFLQRAAGFFELSLRLEDGSHVRKHGRILLQAGVPQGASVIESEPVLALCFRELRLAEQCHSICAVLPRFRQRLRVGMRMRTLRP